MKESFVQYWLGFVEFTTSRHRGVVLTSLPIGFLIGWSVAWYLFDGYFNFLWLVVLVIFHRCIKASQGFCKRNGVIYQMWSYPEPDRPMTLQRFTIFYLAFCVVMTGTWGSAAVTSLVEVFIA